MNLSSIKIDKLKGQLPVGICSSFGANPIFVSAKDGAGLGDLIADLKKCIDGKYSEAEIFLKKENLGLLPSFYKLGVVTETEMVEQGLNFRIRAKKCNLDKLKSLIER